MFECKERSPQVVGALALNMMNLKFIRLIVTTQWMLMCTVVTNKIFEQTTFEQTTFEQITFEQTAFEQIIYMSCTWLMSFQVQ